MALSIMPFARMPLIPIPPGKNDNKGNDDHYNYIHENITKQNGTCDTKQNHTQYNGDWHNGTQQTDTSEWCLGIRMSSFYSSIPIY
jgi:hypothetical protein